MLPKNDGYSVIVLAFVAREFGVGLRLTHEELEHVNRRRNSETWSNYEQKDAAIEIYGSTRKKDIKDVLTLIRFFELGLNYEGY